MTPEKAAQIVEQQTIPALRGSGGDGHADALAVLLEERRHLLEIEQAAAIAWRRPCNLGAWFHRERERWRFNSAGRRLAELRCEPALPPARARSWWVEDRHGASRRDTVTSRGTP